MTRTAAAIARFVAAGLVPAALALGAAGSACAQEFPSRPMRIIVPFPAGGTSDLLARSVAEPLSAAFRQPVVVENRPGGSTVIGTQAAFQAPADGHTLLVTSASFTINPHLVKSLPFDPERDFVAITSAAHNPHILVAHPSLKVATFRELVEAAKSKPGTIGYASFGNGSSGHLGFELQQRAGGFTMVHVPYKGVAPAMTDLVGGQVQVMLTDLPAALPHVRAGRLVALGVASEKRAATLPEAPTLSEAGLPGFVSRSWFGFVTRSGIAPEIVARLNQEIGRALASGTVTERLREAGMETWPSTPAAFGEFLRSESKRYGEAVRVSGAKLD